MGNDATLTCSSDLDASSVEWLYNGQVVVSSSGPQADLMFTPVNDSIHNTEYTCRVTNAYGTLEQSVTTLVEGNFLKEEFKHLMALLSLDVLMSLTFV